MYSIISSNLSIIITELLILIASKNTCSMLIVFIEIILMKSVF